ncbi:MAG: hypothetical protein IPJ65_23050 [Archangiaceae bacterium]|nr:hypothetical protein [Archangiaceae bacterium]
MRWLLFITGLVFTACSSKCPEPQYEGKASDEAYLTMVDAESRATADDAKAPRLDLAEGATLPKSPVPTLRWSSTLTAKAAPPQPRSPPAVPWYRGLVYSEAWAHLPPVTGSIFWFKFAVPGEQCPVEMISTRNEWTPPADVWAKLTAGTGARQVTAQSAYLTENRITEGPYRTSGALSFSISP